MLTVQLPTASLGPNLCIGLGKTGTTKPEDALTYEIVRAAARKNDPCCIQYEYNLSLIHLRSSFRVVFHPLQSGFAVYLAYSIFCWM